MRGQQPWELDKEVRFLGLSLFVHNTARARPESSPFVNGRDCCTQGDTRFNESVKATCPLCNKSAKLGKLRTINESRRIIRYRRCSECGGTMRTTQGVRRAKEKIDTEHLARAAVRQVARKVK